MPRIVKIATCCYCGGQSVLTLGGEAARHELSCANCGAAIRRLKAVKREAAPIRKARPASPEPLRKPRRVSPKKARHRPPRRRKSVFSHVIEELFDELEDLFD